MKIDYPKYPERSSFIEPCENAIDQNRNALVSGHPVTVQFSPRGYNGSVRVTISQTDDTMFEADRDYSDPSRFPRRIRVAAYALFNKHCYGTFDISHKRETGVLTIRRV